jgi:hypothetical protein
MQIWWHLVCSCEIYRNTCQSCLNTKTIRSVYSILYPVWDFRFSWRRVWSYRVFWGVAPCSHVEVDRRFRGAYCPIIALIMEAVRTSETSVNFNVTTRRYIQEDSKRLVSCSFFNTVSICERFRDSQIQWRVWGFHGSVSEHCGFVGCYAMYTVILLYTSVFQMKTASCCSNVMVYRQNNTQFNNPEDHHLRQKSYFPFPCSHTRQ